MRNIYKALSEVQATLKAPKSNRNSFGNYNYRSAEDILEAVKPLLASNDLAMTLSDKVIQVGDKNYIEATVTIYDIGSDSDIVLTATAYAREAQDKKGMDDAQITGAASSYARKYALNGMFNIDDTKDADTDEHTAQRQKAPATEQVQDRVADASKPPEAMGQSDELTRAKAMINQELIKHDYTRPDQKQAFITMVIEKPTIDNIDDANAVMDAIEAEGDTDYRELTEEDIKNHRGL